MWIRRLALVVLTLIFASATRPFSDEVSGMFLVTAGLGSVWAIAIGIRSRFRPLDRYDLGELKRVHDHEELLVLGDQLVVDDPERVVCLACMNEYPHRLPACPRCGLSR